MEARYAFRKTQLLDECQVALEMFEQVIPRLYTFMEPFVKIFHGQVDDQHAKTGLDHRIGHFWLLRRAAESSNAPYLQCLGTFGSLGSSGVVTSCQNKGLQFMPRCVADQK